MTFKRAAAVAVRALVRGGQLALQVCAHQLPDALMLAGAVGVAVGCWHIYAPAGYIAGGLMVFIVGLLATRAR